MIDPHQKLIPALVHKNVANDFVINAYKFERKVQVNTFRPILRPSLLETTAREVQKKLAEEASSVEKVESRFISCVSIPTKMKVVQCQERVEIRSEPFKKTVFTTGVTLMRRFEFEVHPVIEVLDSSNAPGEQGSSESLTFTSTIVIEA